MGISQKKMQELISEKALYPADKSFKGLLRREAIVRSKLRTIYEIAAAPKRGFDNPEHAREVILNILINELNTEVWELREEKRREAARERAIGMQIFFGKLKLGMKRIRR